MSASPSRALEDPAALSPAIEPGNRVLQSIGRSEGLPALLAFSDLHDQIRDRRAAMGPFSDSDLFQTERFVLNEVLQLICGRTQALTNADAVLVALAEGSEMVCRATAGPMPIPRGIRLNTGSEFLSDCLESGRILRCDDAQTDPRLEFDLCRQLDARSTVLVPLRGRSDRLGVLQAFSATAWSFTDQDLRCFDLFAELVLSALKPEDQDRRFRWLSEVADEVLEGCPPHRVLRDERVEGHPTDSARTLLSAQSAPLEPPSPAQAPFLPPLDPVQPPIVIPVAAVELPDLIAAKEEPAIIAEGEEHATASVPGAPSKLRLGGDFLHNVSFPFIHRPGLSVVVGLVAVAALFSAGVWWGIEFHGKTASTGVAATPRSVTSPPAPNLLSPTVSDNLLAPSEGPATEAPLTAVPPEKLAALPKITGLRHWSSSMGSTVVIDMEDQVPYEVHRLMSPERIYFDLHDTVLPPEFDGKTMDVGDASLIRVRAAQPVAGISRIVLDTKDGSNFSVSMESNPYRLVIELHDNELRDNARLAAANRVGQEALVRAAPKPAPTAALAANASLQSLPAKTLPAQPLPVKTAKLRIVLDPGHGGWDLGTVGRQGLLEKDLVLDVTKRLGKLLQARLGSEVMFTRTGDDYLALDQRADFANQTQADLFVSVHANYSKTATARGVETYYTNLFSAPGFRQAGARELEKRADGTFPQPTPVSLSAGSLHEKIEESRRLAASVQRTLYATLAAKSPDIRDRGIKASSFAVLTGTTMPAILTEISFVSSPQDEHNLLSETYRQQIAEALYKGIARYEESSPRAKVAQLRPATTGR
jgi:N-acetylmuramoyl-L-alanine amidase